MDGAIQYWHWLLRTLIKPYVDGFLLESEAEALTTNERDLLFFNHPINSAGAHTQIGTEFLHCEEPLIDHLLYPRRPFGSSYTGWIQNLYTCTGLRGWAQKNEVCFFNLFFLPIQVYK